MLSYLKDFSSSVGDYDSLLQFLSTLLWGIYVYFTIKTFREIRRQTELQSEAFLVVASVILDEAPPERNFVTEAEQIFIKWKEILNTNVPDAVQPERYLALELTNRGRSDVVSWNIAISVRVISSQYLNQKFNIVGDTSSWNVKYNNHRDNIPPNDKIIVPVAIVGAFPELLINWSIEYTDTRGVKYTKFAGDNSATDKNILANPTII